MKKPGELQDMQFVIRHMFDGSNDAPTYYRVDGLGGWSRTSDLENATGWPTEAEAQQVIRQLGLSRDPSVSVMAKGC
jgi:hypothetical protein